MTIFPIPLHILLVFTFSLSSEATLEYLSALLAHTIQEKQDYQSDHPRVIDAVHRQQKQIDCDNHFKKAFQKINLNPYRISAENLTVILQCHPDINQPHPTLEQEEYFENLEAITLILKYFTFNLLDVSAFVRILAKPNQTTFLTLLADALRNSIQEHPLSNRMRRWLAGASALNNSIEKRIATLLIYKLIHHIPIANAQETLALRRLLPFVTGNIRLLIHCHLLSAG
jgi:hypothetical protein